MLKRLPETLKLTEVPLSKQEQTFADDLWRTRQLSEAYRQADDEHRKFAFGHFDVLLENGHITPEQAEKLKKDWDRRHGY